MRGRRERAAAKRWVAIQPPIAGPARPAPGTGTLEPPRRWPRIGGNHP